MPFYQLRITVDASANRSREKIMMGLDRFIKSHTLEAYTCGYEKLNKYGESENCTPHFHFHFVAYPDGKNPLRNLRLWFRNWFSKNESRLKGNKEWAFTEVAEPKDYDRWIRYALKETPVKDFCYGIDNLELEAQRAKDERAISIQHNLNARLKREQKDQFKRKMYEYIEANKPSTPSFRSIWKILFKFYQEQERPMNWNNLDGYTNLWLADAGLLSADAAFELSHKNHNY